MSLIFHIVLVVSFFFRMLRNIIPWTLNNGFSVSHWYYDFILGSYFIFFT